MEHIIHVPEGQKVRAVPRFVRSLQWFGFAEVDLKVPEVLVRKFEEMCPFFINKQVPEEAVPKHMMDYLKRTGRNRGDGRKLVGALWKKCWFMPHSSVGTSTTEWKSQQFTEQSVTNRKRSSLGSWSR